jgi:Carboxypeptidase regulatory-like domain
MEFSAHHLKTARLLALAGWLAPAMVLQAQGDRSSLTGTVVDKAGGVVPGVLVRAVEKATGLARETVTNREGVYALAGLPAGLYSVAFTHAGFAPLHFENIDQPVGLTRSLNVTLTVSARGEEITVSEAVVSLNQTTAALGQGVEQKQMNDLPLNGRNWASLTALVPGAFDSGGSNQRSIRFAGRGLDDNNFTLDGVDATGVLNQAQRGQVRLAIPTTAIAEFRVESALYSAESGGSAGGQVAVASTSGTNQFHGSLFEYFRNDVLDARSPFDPSQAPPFRLNQFGSSVGGPIVPGRTFFFATYEAYRQRLGQTITGFVPSSAFRASAAPSLAPILAAYPAGNGPLLDDNTNLYLFQGSQIANEDSGMFRLDQRFSDRLGGFLRFNMDESVSNVPLGSVGQKQDIDTRPKNGVAQALEVLSPTLTNEYKFGFNQEITHTANLSPLAYAISAPGFSSIQNSQTKDERGTTFSWIDNLSWVHGRHTVKAGVEIRRIQMNQGNSFSGTLTYSTLANLAANQVDQAQQTALLPLKRLRKTQYFAHVQDELKLQPNLTLNLGIRYQFFNVFHEVDNRAVPFDFNTCGGYCPPGSEFSFPNKHDFDPRISLAYVPGAFRGRTVLRTGLGILHGDGQLDDQNLPIANDVARFNLTRVGFPDLSYPIEPFLNQATGIVTPRLLDRHRKDMYVTEWGASIQQDLGSGTIGTISYAASKGTHLLSTSYVNVLNAAGLRPYPAFGRVEYRGNNNNGSFQGFQASVQRRFDRGLLFTANYLWSHSIDDGSLGGGEADFPQNVNCRSCERASSDQDSRQVWNANLVYDLPLGGGKRYFSQPGMARKLLSGWQLAAIGTARAGLPVTVSADRSAADVPDGNTASQRPDVVAGVPVVPPGGRTPQQWINPAAFATPAKGTWGDAGRNLVRGPGTYQFDAALSRRFVLTERWQIEFRGEAFNLTNHPQYGLPIADFSAGPTFGKIVSLVNSGPIGSGTPRQFQLSLRARF